MAELAAGSTMRSRIGIARRAWVVWAGVSVLFVLFGLDDLRQGGASYAGGERVLFEGIAGTTWDALQASRPAVANMIDTLVRTGGIDLVVLGLLCLTIALHRDPPGRALGLARDVGPACSGSSRQIAVLAPGRQGARRRRARARDVGDVPPGRDRLHAAVDLPHVPHLSSTRRSAQQAWVRRSG